MLLWILTTVCISLKCLLLCQIEGFSACVFLIHLKANLDEIQNLRSLGLCKSVHVCERDKCVWMMECGGQCWKMNDSWVWRWAMIPSAVLRGHPVHRVGGCHCVSDLTSRSFRDLFPCKDALEVLGGSLPKSNSSLGESHLKSRVTELYRKLCFNSRLTLNCAYCV